LTGRYFLAELPGDENPLPNRFLAYSADGTILEQHPLMQGPTVGPPAPQSHPTSEPREIEVAPMNFGGAPGGTLLLVGPVGSQITTLELRYQDGRSATVPLHAGWALYEIAPADYVPGRRPQTLIGRDNSRQQIESQRLPWAPPRD
ncbi:MAG: hypothetical protein JF604_10985, partial [Bradyrhizobium sp.]|nr:hypothetical protein [Bradyrhizobium sp.]